MNQPPDSGGLPLDYPRFLRDLKDRISAARVKAVLSVNREMIALYWDLGRQVVERQKKGRWGTAVIERLAHDLRVEFPEMTGLSANNIWRMRAFFLAWAMGKKAKKPAEASARLILAQPVQELDSTRLPRAAGELPWGHNIVLFQKVKSRSDRLWYARQALEHGWSRNVLALQIDHRLHLRQGKALTNFKRTLPPLQSDLAQQALKDDYALDFLKNTKSRERDLEKSMVEHVQSFLLELGAGFAFVGRQHHLEVGGEDFYLDLLFYHVHLHCYIVIELKAGAFKPEHAGKMSFYLSAADDLLRRPGDGPTIGIILCRSKNKVIAEYAVRDSHKPIGVSSYQLTKALPEALARSLPTIDELEEKLRPKASMEKTYGEESDLPGRSLPWPARQRRTASSHRPRPPQFAKSKI